VPALLDSALDIALDRVIVPGYSRVGFNLRRRSWKLHAEQRLDSRTVAITGATSGLGEAAAIAFARLGAQVLLLARSPVRGELARWRIVAASGSDRVAVVPCDLADLASVRSCAATILERGDGPAVVVNNAGVLTATRELSADGIELTLSTNVIGPFLLTNLLVPGLESAAPARVINVSSGGMYAQRLRVDDLQMERGRWSGVAAYARSKRAQVILTELWAARLRDRGIFVHAMHPGWVDTPGVASSLPRFRRMTGPILRTPAQGADTIVWLATAQLPGVVTGGFWHDRRRRPTHLVSRTRETKLERELLWKRCVYLSGYDPDRGSAVSRDRAAAG
jgi:NAD(P)-dependent dehydrogenase (short-subunit alcohol dehydrogenase family)